MGREQVAVDNDSYLILTTGRSIPAESNRRLRRIVSVFFSPDFAFDTLRSLITPHDQLLDLPKTSAQPVTFFQHRLRCRGRRCSRRCTRFAKAVFRGHYSKRLAGRSVSYSAGADASVHRQKSAPISRT